MFMSLVPGYRPSPKKVHQTRLGCAQWSNQWTSVSNFGLKTHTVVQGLDHCKHLRGYTVPGVPKNGTPGKVLRDFRDWYPQKWDTGQGWEGKWWVERGVGWFCGKVLELDGLIVRELCKVIPLNFMVLLLGSYWVSMGYVTLFFEILSPYGLGMTMGMATG